MSQEDIENAIDDLVKRAMESGASAEAVISALEVKLYAYREELGE